jgi:hypothetical protein
MKKTALVCFLTVVALLGLSRPSSAAVTASLSIVGPNPLTTTCPVNVNFTGSINGPAGPVTYTFGRFVNGSSTSSAPINAAIPTSGTLPISVTLNIDKAHSGFQSYEIDVTSPSAAQGKVYFTVTCANPNAVLHPGMNPLVRPVVTLHSQWWALREYEYKWVGTTTYIPERGTGPCGNLCIGWYHLHNGDSFWLYHWNTYDRAFLGFDPTAFNGLNVTKATLTLNVVQGDANCYGGLGRALLAKIPAAKFTSQTFSAPYPDDGDFNWPTSTQFSAGSATIDVTSIVQQWASGKMRNDGFVLRGKVEDNGSNGNDSCSLGFGTDGVLTIAQ